MDGLRGIQKRYCIVRATKHARIAAVLTVLIIIQSTVTGDDNMLDAVPEKTEFTSELVGLRPFEESLQVDSFSKPIQLTDWQEVEPAPVTAAQPQTVQPPALLSVNQKDDPLSTLDRADVFAPPVDIDFGGMVKWTVIVCLLGLGVVVALKKVPRSSKLLTGDRTMQIVETISLGTRGALYLVAVHGERYLAATDATGVKSLTLIPNWDLSTTSSSGDESFTTVAEKTLGSEKTLSILQNRKTEVA